MKAEGVRYVVCRNEAEAENDRKDREAIVAALDAQLKKGDKALIGNSAYRRYLRKVGAKGAHSFEMPDLNTWFLQWIDWIGVSAKFNLAWHYAWGGRGGFERIWTGPAAGVGRDGRAAARRCGHS